MRARKKGRGERASTGGGKRYIDITIVGRKSNLSALSHCVIYTPPPSHTLHALLCVPILTILLNHHDRYILRAAREPFVGN